MNIYCGTFKKTGVEVIYRGYGTWDLFGNCLENCFEFVLDFGEICSKLVGH